MGAEGKDRNKARTTCETWSALRAPAGAGLTRVQCYDAPDASHDVAFTSKAQRRLHLRSPLPLPVCHAPLTTFTKT
jgi:hypothetical protein